MLFFIFGYEGEETNPASSQDPTPKTFSQEEVNRINKAEREKRQAAEKQAKDLQELLDSLQKQQTMTAAEKEELTSRLEEYEKAKMTEEQRKEHEINKLKKTFEENNKTLQDQLSKVLGERDNLIITRSIKDACMSGELKAADGTGNQILAILRHSAVVDENNEVVIKGFSYVDDGKTITEDLPVADAINKMKLADEWANLWNDPTTQGVQNPTRVRSLPGDYKPKDFREYMKHRAEGKIPYLKK